MGTPILCEEYKDVLACFFKTLISYSRFSGIDQTVLCLSGRDFFMFVSFQVLVWFLYLNAIRKDCGEGCFLTGNDAPAKQPRQPHKGL